MRLPHAFVGALCLGFALANFARPAGSPGAWRVPCPRLRRFRSLRLAPAIGGARVRSRRRRLGLGKRTADSARPQRARDPDRHGGVGGGGGRGTATAGDVRSANEGAGSSLGHASRGTSRPCSSSRSGARLRRARDSGSSASCGLRAGLRRASTSQRGCGGRVSMWSCALSRSGWPGGAAVSPASATASGAGWPATRRRARRVSDET